MYQKIVSEDLPANPTIGQVKELFWHRLISYCDATNCEDCPMHSGCGCILEDVMDTIEVL